MSLPAKRSGPVSWVFHDWANNGFDTVIPTFIFAPYFTDRVSADATTGSYLWGNMLSGANLAAALIAPLLGAMADRSGRRKPWLAAFTLLCVFAVAALWFMRPDPSWTWPALLVVGWLTWLAHSQRVGLSVVLAFFLAGGAVPAFVPEADRALDHGNLAGDHS